MKLSLLLCLFAVTGTLFASSVFYYAPPPLARYPERIPAKTATALLAETLPKPVDTVDLGQLVEQVQQELSKAPMARDLIRQRIDAILQANRIGDYSARLANYLWDLRDLIDNLAAPEAEIVAYSAWRAQVMAGHELSPKPSPVRLWSQSDTEYETALAWHRLRIAETVQKLEDELAKASPSLQPHWLCAVWSLSFWL
jgi:hypothetical protein